MRVSIVIPTLDGGELFRRCLNACLRQDPTPSEILVVDSGSTDGTAELAMSTPGVSFHGIDRSEFGHGRTRNLGASMTQGDVIVFLTQDAIPTERSWLSALVDPFLSSSRVGLAYGRQVPHPNCRVTVKRDVSSYFRSLSEDGTTRIVASPPGAVPDSRSRFFSNVNSAVRRSTWEEVRFRNVDYSEDLAFAEDALAAGWWKAYVPGAAVRHSHDLRLRPYYRRMHDEFEGLRRALDADIDDHLTRHLAAALLGTVRDVIAAATDPDYRFAERVRGVLTAPAYNAARRMAIRRSVKP